MQYGIIDRFISGIVFVFRAGGRLYLSMKSIIYKYKDIINALISKGKNQPESCSTQPTSFFKLILVKNWTQVSLVIRFKIHLTRMLFESKIKIYYLKFQIKGGKFQDNNKKWMFIYLYQKKKKYNIITFDIFL